MRGEQVPAGEAGPAADYRAHLAARWGIDALDWAEMEAQLPEADLDAWDEVRADLSEGWNTKTQGFFEWVAEDPVRFGLVHSAKWVGILSSGVWATRVIEALAPVGSVLELGCNAGYWCSWLASRGDRRVAGVDISGASIALGRAILGATSTPALVETDLRAFVPDQGFDCLVSLQTLFYLSDMSDFEDALRHLGTMMRKDGLLISVDQYPSERLADVNQAYTNAGFEVIAQGLVGGLGCDGEWGAYPGIVFGRSTSPGGPSLAQVYDRVTQEWEQEFAPFVRTLTIRTGRLETPPTSMKLVMHRSACCS